MRETAHPAADRFFEDIIRINKELNDKSRTTLKFFNKQTQKEGERRRDTYETFREPFTTIAYELNTPFICFKGIYIVFPIKSMNTQCF